jgi:hypothetical protein
MYECHRSSICLFSRCTHIAMAEINRICMGTGQWDICHCTRSVAPCKAHFEQCVRACVRASMNAFVFILVCECVWGGTCACMCAFVRACACACMPVCVRTRVRNCGNMGILDIGCAHICISQHRQWAPAVDVFLETQLPFVARAHCPVHMHT